MTHRSIESLFFTDRRFSPLPNYISFSSSSLPPRCASEEFFLSISFPPTGRRSRWGIPMRWFFCPTSWCDSLVPPKGKQAGALRKKPLFFFFFPDAASTPPFSERELFFFFFWIAPAFPFFLLDHAIVPHFTDKEFFF